MARLKVRLRGKVVSELNLATDRSYLAGRRDDCDIRLQADKGISREHFRLVWQNDVWMVETLSRFGELLMAGEKVANAPLENGVIFQVPPYEFEFVAGEAGALVEHASHFPQAVGSDAHADMISDKTFVGAAPSIPYIKILSADGEAKELIRIEGGDSWIAGRDSACQIHIKDARVSRRQFEIRKAGNAYTILDLGSVNGTLVNGTPVSSQDPSPLKSGDAITVLENRLVFELHDPNFRSRLELVNMQPLPESLPALLPVSEAMPPAPLDHWQQSSLPMPYDPSQMAPAPEPLPETGVKGLLQKIDYEKNKKKILLGAIAVLALIMIFSGGESKDTSSNGLSPLHQDPLSKLGPEQRKLVKDTLQLAKSYYMQGKYEFARTELLKMSEIVPEYEDSKSLMSLVDEALYVQAQHRKEEELTRARQEQDEKIRRKVEECRKGLNPNSTKDQMETCLADVLAFQPDHPLFAQLFADVDRMVEQRQAEQVRQQAYAGDVAKLKGMFGRARDLESKGKLLEAIEAYSRVAGSSLPDPGGNKGEARSRVADLKAQVNLKTKKYQDDADQFAKEDKLKSAIQSLRKARQVDPLNPDLQPKIDALMQKLKEKMMTIYQEGVLEESFGNVEGGENKPGAKDKWKRIIEQDVEDGDYYKKAYIKLKKYGAI